MSDVRSFRLPDLGEGLTDAEIVAWHVATGDAVALNQVLAEVETEKAVVELPSPFAGTVVELLAAPGETVAVGAPIVTIETVASEAPAPSADASDQEGIEKESPPQQVPTLVGYGPSEAVPSRRRSRRHRSQHHEHPGGATVESGTTRDQNAPPARTSGPVFGQGEETARPLAAPPVRFMARQEGVDLADVAGHGPGGIITRDDLAAYIRSDAGAPATTGSPGTADTAWTTGDGGSREHAPPEPTRTPLRGIQKRMAEAMVRSVAEAPQACVFLSLDVSETTALVERLRSNRRFDGVRVTLLSIVAKAVLRALDEHPELNSSMDGSRREILSGPHVNLGIAVAAPAGLLVPNIPAAESLGLKDLARAVGDLTTRALERADAHRRNFGAARSPSPTLASSASTGEWPSSIRERREFSPSARSGGRHGSMRARSHCATS